MPSNELCQHRKKMCCSVSCKFLFLHIVQKCILFLDLANPSDVGVILYSILYIISFWKAGMFDLCRFIARSRLSVDDG